MPSNKRIVRPADLDAITLDKTALQELFSAGLNIARYQFIISWVSAFLTGAPT